MRIYENGTYRDLTPDEQLAMQAAQAEAEAEYWRGVDYGEAVNTLIRERYSLDAELAISRQRETKPDEFAAYFAFCEECKATAKAKKEYYK